MFFHNFPNEAIDNTRLYDALGLSKDAKSTEIKLDVLEPFNPKERIIEWAAGDE